MTAERETMRDDELGWQLDAEAITIRIRWFGLLFGAAWVNFASLGSGQTLVNAILVLGAVYAILDTAYSLIGRVFLKEWPLFVSAMEAVFIGLLCYSEAGLHSPFRFYYVLSLMVCAIRHSASLTYSTFALHSLSYAAVAVASPHDESHGVSSLVMMEVLLGWVTWASTSLIGVLRRASARLAELNRELQLNQTLLEDRISLRTRELQQSQAMLVQHEKQAAFGLLAAGIAHEVGNPLAGISSIVQLLNRRNIDDHTRTKLQLVDDQLRRIQRTLKELVTFSRPASPAASVFTINEVIDAAVSIAKYYKRRKHRSIETKFSPNLPPLRLVRDQLVQVFLNLVLNALDATPEGGTILLKTSRSEGWIDVSVSDTGHGIPLEQQSRIFQPYFTTKEHGTGLGLFVCRSMIEKQAGGRIELVRSDETGTEFVVSLPLDAELARTHDAALLAEQNDRPVQRESPLEPQDGDAVASPTFSAEPSRDTIAAGDA